MTVSCLPRFAQPYRLICNATIEAFFEGRSARNDVRAWSELLGRYRRAYQRWFETLRMECGALFGRSPPEQKPLALLGPDHEGLWRPSFRHRQAGRPVKNNALWTLPLPPTPDFPGFEAEESLAPAFVVNPHRTGLWHKARPAANGLGDEGRGV